MNSGKASTYRAFLPMPQVPISVLLGRFSLNRLRLKKTTPTGSFQSAEDHALTDSRSWFTCHPSIPRIAHTPGTPLSSGNLVHNVVFCFHLRNANTRVDRNPHGN